MLRGQRFKYVAYSEGKNREFLVDLDKDPGEMKNLAGDPAFDKVLNEYRALLSEWCAKTHDTFPVPSHS